MRYVQPLKLPQTIGIAIVILSTGEEDDAISREGNLELRPFQVSGELPDEPLGT
jgi:hypothetical protein